MGQPRKSRYIDDKKCGELLERAWGILSSPPKETSRSDLMNMVRELDNLSKYSLYRDKILQARRFRAMIAVRILRFGYPSKELSVLVSDMQSADADRAAGIKEIEEDPRAAGLLAEVDGIIKSYRWFYGSAEL